MTSLFNDNENIACESCGKVIMREMSFCSVMTPLNNLSNKIEILYDDQNQPWFKRAHLGKHLNMKGIHMSIPQHVELRTREQLSTCNRISGWKGDSNSKNKTDIFLSFTAALHVVMRCDKKEAIPIRDWLVKEIIPRGLNQIISEKQQALENKDLIIHQNESTIAILNDDLDESQREYAILEYKYEQLEYRAVPYLEDPKKDNGIVVIQKNNGDEYPYIAICGQQGYVAQKIKNKLIDFPNGQIVVLAETGNSIVHYNWLRERGCIIVNPDRVRHFRLGTMTHQQLLYLEEA